MNELTRNRQFGPSIQSIRNIPIPTFNVFQLDNGIQVHYINDGSQELCKLDVVFEGGRHTEDKAVQARAFSTLLKEGTQSKNSAELSDFFDYYGASYTTRSSLDYTTITLMSLSKHFPKLISVLGEMILQAVFPQEELDKFVTTSIRRLEQDNAKNDILAYKKLTDKIFGSQNVYGYNSTAEDYQTISRTDILDYYKGCLSEQKCHIFLCGKFTDDIIRALNQALGQWDYKGDLQIEYLREASSPQQLRFFGKQELQGAIKLGRHFGNRHQEDYANLIFLSNILGGFFGSRLMKNIREDKAWTYNIYSDLDAMLFDGYFHISTEMAPEHIDSAIVEIHKEMERLANELVPMDELDMNKNYILGNLLTAIDGPFQAIRLIKSAVLNRRTREDVERTIHTFAEMTPDLLCTTAQKYLNPADYTHIIVAK